MAMQAWTARKARKTKAEVLQPITALKGRSERPAQMAAHTWRLQAMLNR